MSKEFLHRLHLRRLENRHRMSSRTDVECHFFTSVVSVRSCGGENTIGPMNGEVAVLQQQYNNVIILVSH